MKPKWLPPHLIPFWEAPNLTLLTALLVGEAEGEPLLGRYAVACVVRSRWKGGWWGDGTLASVCLAPAQFSCFWASFTVLRKKLLQALEFPDAFEGSHEQAASCLMDCPDPPMFGGATVEYYLNTRIAKPSWMWHLVPVCRIGRHTFFSAYGA